MSPHPYPINWKLSHAFSFFKDNNQIFDMASNTWKVQSASLLILLASVLLQSHNSSLSFSRGSCSLHIVFLP